MTPREMTRLAGGLLSTLQAERRENKRKFDEITERLDTAILHAQEVIDETAKKLNTLVIAFVQFQGLVGIYGSAVSELQRGSGPLEAPPRPAAPSPQLFGEDPNDPID